jgi:hypothetical protein
LGKSLRIQLKIIMAMTWSSFRASDTVYFVM